MGLVRRYGFYRAQEVFRRAKHACHEYTHPVNNYHERLLLNQIRAEIAGVPLVEDRAVYADLHAQDGSGFPLDQH